jgi:hypothetical protein
VLHCNPGRLNLYRAIGFTGFDSLYKPDGFVGKSIIKLKMRQGNLCSEGDSEMYDRWAQAMSSCYDLCDHAFDGCSEGSAYQAFVLPVVVVPNDSLWKANYDEKGTLRDDPSRADLCEYYINQQIPISEIPNFVITHVHFATLSGLSQLLTHFVAARTRAWKAIFGNESA